MPRMMMRQQLHDIVAPHDHDVLSGRGNFVNYHAGNEHFRSLVRKHKVAYVACPKQQKGKFSRLIVEEIRARNPPGRFLKQDPVTKLWHDIGEKKALDKTRQALREGAPEIMKEIGGDDDAPPETADDDSEGGSPTPPVTSSELVEKSPTPTLPTSSTHSQQQRCSPGGPQSFSPSRVVDEIGSSGAGVPFMQQRQLCMNNELLGQHSQHGALGHQSQHGGLGHSQHNNLGHSQHRNPLGHSQHGNPLGHSQHGNPLGHSQHGNPLGHSQHGNLLGHSQHGNPLGRSQHGNPLGHSQHTNPLGHSQHTNPLGHSQHTNPLGHSQHTNPLGQHSQHGNHDLSGTGGFTPSNIPSSMQNGMRSLAELRMQMQQQHQRQQGGFSGGNFIQGPNSGGAMFSPDVSLQNKLASLTQMQQAMFQQNHVQQPIDDDDDDDSDDFEFEPRPIAPGIASIQQALPYPQMSGATNESVSSMAEPRKASARVPRRGDLLREGSDRSLEMNSVFSKELGSDLKIGQSANNLSVSAGSIMSLSIGDIGQDIDDATDVEPMPPPKSLNPQELMEGAEGDPSDLAAIFDSSMKLKVQKPIIHNRSNWGNASDTGRGLDMSVATLGDSSVFNPGDYNGDASMGTNFAESFSNIFDITS